MYAAILNHVFENGRVTTDSEKDWKGFLAELEAEVYFEAAERGFSEEECEKCVEFALSHVGV